MICGLTFINFPDEENFEVHGAMQIIGDLGGPVKHMGATLSNFSLFLQIHYVRIYVPTIVHEQNSSIF